MPDQGRLLRRVDDIEALRAGGGAVIAIGLQRHHHRTRRQARDHGADAHDELARARRQQDALRRHAVPVGQLLAQGLVVRVRVARGIGLADGVKHLRTRPAGVGVGREIPTRRALGVRPAVAAAHRHGSPVRD